MRRKGLTGIFLTFGLIIIYITSLIYIIPHFSGTYDNSAEKRINNMVFLLRDTADLAKNYLDTAARYSLQQAAYENGKLGGLESIDPSRATKHENVFYTLWYRNGDVSPDRVDMLESIIEKTNNNFMQYTDDGSINALIWVTIPGYDKPIISNIDNQSLSLSISGDNLLSVLHETEEGDKITISKDSDIELAIRVPYFALFNDAKSYHYELIPKLPGCKENEIEVKNESFCCVTTSEVVESSGGCKVKVETITKKKFLIWNGTDAVFEPIRLVFLEYEANVVEIDTE